MNHETVTLPARRTIRIVDIDPETHNGFENATSPIELFPDQPVALSFPKEPSPRTERRRIKIVAEKPSEPPLEGWSSL